MLLLLYAEAYTRAMLLCVTPRSVYVAAKLLLHTPLITPCLRHAADAYRHAIGFATLPPSPFSPAAAAARIDLFSPPSPDAAY